MTTAAPEHSASPRRPMRMTDPRGHRLSQEKFDSFYIDCSVLGGITRRERCPLDCSDYQGAGCPLRESDAGCKELTTSPSDEVTGNELTLKAVTVDLADTPAQVEDGGGDGCSDRSEPSVRASDMVERDSEDEARLAPAPPAPLEPELLLEAEEPGASTTTDGLPATELVTAAEPSGETPQGLSHSTESDPTPLDEEEPLVAAEDVPDVPVVLDAVEHGSKATDCGVLEVDVPPPASGLIQAADGGDLWNYLTGLVGGDSAPTAGDVTPSSIRTWHLEIEACTRRAVIHACLIGLALLEQKASLPHGQFKPWVDKHCSFSYSTANMYMRVARWAVKKYSARDFSWADMSIREIDRLLPSPGKKTRGDQKHTKGPASTSSPETSSPADTHDAPSLATSTHSTGEKPEVGTSSAATTGAGDAVEVEDVAADSPDATMEPKCTCDTTFDVEAAMAMILKDIEAHRKPQARAIELIERIAGSFGITVSLRGELIALRRTRPAKTSVPSSPPRRVLRYSDVVDMNGAGASKGATG